MKNLASKAKLYLSFIIVVVLATALGGIGLIGIKSLRESAYSMYNLNLISIEAIGELRESFLSQRADIRSVFLSANNAATLESLNSAIAESDKNAAWSFAMYEGTITDESLEGEYYAMKETWTGSYAEAKARILSLIDAGEPGSAYKELMIAEESCIRSITRGLNAIADSHHEQSERGLRALDSMEVSIMTVIILIVVVVIAISVFLVVCIHKTIKTADINVKNLPSYGDNTITIGKAREIVNREHAANGVGFGKQEYLVSDLVLASQLLSG